MSGLAAEIDCQRHRYWMTRLLLSGLLILASLALAMQSHAQRGLGSGHYVDQSLVAAAVDSGPYLLAKTVQTIALARKQVPQDNGPDEAPKIVTLRAYPQSGAASGPGRLAAVSGFVTEHILYRDGSRAISSRAPPPHISV